MTAIILAGAVAVEQNIIGLTDGFAPVRIFPDPLSKSVFNEFLLALGDGGFLFVEDSGFPIVLLIMCIAAAMFLSTVCVFFRDIEYLWDVLLMLLMYCSAIFYYVDNIGSSVVRTVIRMNPLYCIIENFRHIVLLGESIFTSSMEINMLIYSSVFSVVALVISVIVFKKNQDRFILYI